MATKGEETNYYCPLPTPQEPHHHHHLHLHLDHQEQPDQHYVLLPVYYPRSRFRYRRRRLFCFTSLIFLCLATFLLWPSDPDLKVVRLRLNHVHLHTSPPISLDISMALSIKVRNRDFFSLDYHSLVASIGYRGRQLGFVRSNQGHLMARDSSYVNATLQLDGIEVLHDAFYLLEDLAKGSIPFDTVAEVHGQLGLLFFEVPLKTKVSCKVYMNTDNQTIIRQDCYP